jgi:hypothetical protein
MISVELGTQYLTRIAMIDYKLCIL